jgi:hypothetical protein
LLSQRNPWSWSNYPFYQLSLSHCLFGCQLDRMTRYSPVYVGLLSLVEKGATV